jgi:catechol 2,3-dioxygenase-like lactoylglutathione lyase family enzyme
MRLRAPVLGSPDPSALASFYELLLGWTRAAEDVDFVRLQSPEGGTGLSFQLEPHHVRPVWPAVPGEPQMTAHLDIAVDDLAAAEGWALDAGATLADTQPDPDDLRVMLDPDGHPFCLFEVDD